MLRYEGIGAPTRPTPHQSHTSHPAPVDYAELKFAGKNKYTASQCEAVWTHAAWLSSWGNVPSGNFLPSPGKTLHMYRPLHVNRVTGWYCNTLFQEEQGLVDDKATEEKVFITVILNNIYQNYIRTVVYRLFMYIRVTL